MDCIIDLFMISRDRFNRAYGVKIQRYRKWNTNSANNSVNIWKHFWNT